MFYPGSTALLRNLAAGLTLMLAASGCSKSPPGPTITQPTTGGGTGASVNATGRDFAAYDQLVWADEFDGTSLDATKWQYEVNDQWFNNEQEATTNSRNNLFVQGGFLNIVAQQESYHGKPYTSARINTKGKQDFNFGRVDVRAKLPSGQGLWPAIWMLGTNDSQVSWPACGEIDIMELRGRIPNTFLTTMHYGATVAQHQQSGTQYSLTSDTPGDFTSDFHIFSVVRSQDKLEFYIDGKSYYSLTSGQVTPYPFNNPFYAILNVAVGGDFDGGRLPDSSVTFPQTMQVDYVHYLQYKQ